MYRIFETPLFILIVSPLLLCQSFHIKQAEKQAKFNFEIEQQNSSGLLINFSIEENFLDEAVKINNPELLRVKRFIAIPNGALPFIEITFSSKKKFLNVTVPNFNIKNYNIVNFTRSIKIRGVDAVMFGVNPFEYDPVTKKLIIFDKLKLNIAFNGGDGFFGEGRLRNRWWDQIYKYVFLNYETLPLIENNFVPDSVDEGFEYVIITPDNPGYLSWADSLRNFRTLQGINTGVVTLNEIGGNDAALIENFIDEAYNTWEIPPAAVLLLGDYGNGPATGNGIISPVYNNYCVSDNIYGDVDGDNLPDIIVSRITAQNNDDLESIISKILNYERTPPSFPGFYNHPLCVSGWPPSGTSVLCAEVIFGFYENVLGKQPGRQYSGYGGGAPPAWPSDPYSNSLIQIFGTNGLGYVPATPSYLTNWTGSAAGINNAINSGTFAVYYRGQGSVNSWSEPAYTINDLSELDNDLPPFVVSLTSLSGKFNYSDDCLAEAFLKHPNGALGVIAATEITYSSVTSDYGWGLYDYLWPQFLLEIPPNPPYRQVLPAFANAAAKYFLHQNNSTFYTQQEKEVTYYLFHYLGDTFSTVYTELPQNLTVIHDSLLVAGQTVFTVSADENALICLTVNGGIIAVETGTGLPLDIEIPPQIDGDTMFVTITKQNYYRYSKTVSIQSPNSIDENNVSVIKNFALFQNYPNPFNPTTIIAWQIPTSSNVSLIVYDMLGKEIAKLVDEEKPAGAYETEFSGANLPSGIYFYQLKVGSFIETEKMVILK